MLTVTSGALDRLSRKLARSSATEGEALRFTRDDSRWRLRLDRARPDDTAFTHEGRRVLLLDKKMAEAMAAMKLDVRRTEQGARLKLKRLKRE